MANGCNRFYAYLTVLCTILMMSNQLHALSSLARNDAYPVFSTLDPHHFLQTQEKLELKGWLDEDEYWRERVSLSISAIAQNADKGRPLDGFEFKGNQPVELGDIPHRWNMIALLFGELPKGVTSLPPTLQKAREKLFPDVPAGTAINEPTVIDSKDQLFGYFTIPLKYRKRGVRFEVAAQILGDFGIQVQTGVVDMCQTVTGLCDLSAKATFDANTQNETDPAKKTFGCGKLTLKDVQSCLMEELKNIAEEIGLDICSFHSLSIEDIRLRLYWRHVYELNRGRTHKWSDALLIPFFVFEGSVATGKKKEPSKAFGLPFGNNDHNAVGVTAGINLDFVETIEFGLEAGFTHFFDRDFQCHRVPNSLCQSNIFPFTTDVTVSPGHNWHFGGKISAYHFLDNLSFTFQYLVIDHDDDTIKLKCPDPAFDPQALAKTTSFKTKVANIAFNYDVSPHIGIGFLWQAPLSQRNSYRSTSLLFGFNAIF